MKLTNRTYTLELTHEEIDMIRFALNCEVEYRREQIAEKKQSTEQKDHIEANKMELELAKYKELRNDMASLIGITYMGIDA